MSENVEKLLSQILSVQRIREIDEWIAKYPSNQRQSAVMSALRITQEEKGYLSAELMDAIADYLDMPPIAVYEVATFYTMYKTKPEGCHEINVCTNISCQLRGSADILSYLEDKLGIRCGQTTADNKFTLRSVECLGACVNAPMMQIDKTYHETLTNDKIDDILEQYP